MNILNRVFAGAILALAMCTPAFAADDSLTAKNAAGSTITICSKDVGSGVMAACHVVADANGVKMTPAPGFSGVGTTGFNRPADTTTYAANDAWANSTSSPTSGGFTLSSMCRTSGGSGILASLTVVSSNDPSILLQGELWIFDSSVTAVNDNAAFALSDSDAVKLVGVVPFAMATTVAGSGTYSYYHVDGLNLAYTCAGTADLRYLVKVKNAYVPANAETLTVRAVPVGLN